jgi:hypothetical protein
MTEGESGGVRRRRIPRNLSRIGLRVGIKANNAYTVFIIPQSVESREGTAYTHGWPTTLFGIIQMKTILRNILAVIIGLVVGGALNMALITVGPHVIAPPAGVDVTNAQSLAASMHLLEPKHFLFPFLAHALGTLMGALIAFLIATSNRSALAYAIGAISLAGGIAATFMFPAPLWFIILDLAVAYIPMAWIGIQLGRRIKGNAGDAKI